MTDTTIHATGFATRATWRARLSRIAASLHRSFYRAMVARHTRYALEALPDWLIRDIGLTRDDIAFAADAIASAKGDPGRDATHRADRAVTGHRATAGRLPRTGLGSPRRRPSHRSAGTGSARCESTA